MQMQFDWLLSFVPVSTALERMLLQK
jgi:hypothetical protein